MLVKSHSNSYLEEFGLLSPNGKEVYFIDGEVAKVSSLKLSSVVKIIATWMDKDIKVKCKIADTVSKKRIGLQGYSKLEENRGMYFPYSDYTDVTFHQGTVPFSLDILFLRDSEIINTVEKTKIGSCERWECYNCDGVIELNGGFCDRNGVSVDDQILISAVSNIDINELNLEKRKYELSMASND